MSTAASPEITYRHAKSIRPTLSRITDISAVLSSLNLHELGELRDTVTAEYAKRAQVTSIEFIAKMREEAIKYGLNPNQVSYLVTEKKYNKRGPKSPPVPKYCHPEDSTKTWTGCGMPPRWFRDLCAQGWTREDLLINKADH